jgi:hypothetical protein
VTSPSERFGPQTRSVTCGVRLWAKRTTRIARGVSAFLKWANQSPVGFFSHECSLAKGQHTLCFRRILGRGSPSPTSTVAVTNAIASMVGSGSILNPALTIRFPTLTFRLMPTTVSGHGCATPQLLPSIHSGLHFSETLAHYLYICTPALMF